MCRMTSLAAREFTRLIEIMAALRGPDGCPWDREQTIDSLKPFVLEEAYEVLEANHVGSADLEQRHEHEPSLAVSSSAERSQASGTPLPEIEGMRLLDI